jgi:hypothetical protein
MYKTAIARIEGKSSYDEALNSFRASYPEYEVRGVKQSSNGWIAFIQKSAYEMAIKYELHDVVEKIKNDKRLTLLKK